MASLEQKRETFRKYLESAGAIECLSKALIKLYQQEQKPEDACKYIRQIMCETCPTDEQVAEMTKGLADAKQEICCLKKEILSMKGEVRRSSSEVALALGSGFEKLTADEECKSLLKKHLKEEVFNELKEKKTTLKSTLLDCVQSGLENHDSGVGLYAADAECYELFAALFNPVINEYHVDFGEDKTHPASDWGDAGTFENLDPEGEFIVSTRVRCGRSIEGFPFNPRMTMDHYEQIMARVKTVLEGLTEELKGTFHPLEGMTKELQQQLIDDHYLFKEGDKFLQTANACRFWPIGRAIFLNETKTFLVWVNEEDHLRIISMDKGGDLGTVYKRLITAVDAIAKDVAFIRNDRLGYLTFCPSNLGTTIRASVHIKLPKLGKSREKLEEAAAKHNLQVRGTRGEHTESEAGVFDISNKRRLGLTEYEAVKQMYDGIRELIELEKVTEDVPVEEKKEEKAEEAKPEEAKPEEPAAKPAE